MKKKVLSILLIGVMCISLSGCGVFSIMKNFAKVKGSDSKPEETPAVTVSEAPVASPDVVEIPPEIEEIEEPQEYVAGFDRANLVHGNKKLYMAEEDHSLTEYLEVPEGESILGADANNVLAYVMTSEGNDSGVPKYIYCLFSPKDYVRYQIPEEFAITIYESQITVHDDMLYFNYYEEDSNQIWQPAICKFDGVKGTFVKDVKYTDLLKKITDEVPQGRPVHTNIVYDLDRYGCFYVSDYTSVTTFDENFQVIGRVFYQGGSETFSNVEFLENNYALLMSYESDEILGTSMTYYLMNLESQEVTDFEKISGYNGINGIGIDDEYLYYYIRTPNSMGYAPSFEYFRKPLAWEGESETLLFSESCHENDDPALWCLPGLGGTIVHGKLYSLSNSGSDMRWYIVDIADLDNLPQIGPNEYAIQYKQYGEITSKSEDFEETMSGYEDEEGNPVEDKTIKYYECYGEYFKFNDDIPHAEEMNAVLEEIDHDFEAGCESTKETAYDDLIGYYDPSYPSYSTYSNVRSVESIEKIGSHYIQIGMSYYDYWGGAHGMGGTTYYLFDGDTGSLCSFHDLYPGDNSSFQKLATAYTVADWKADSGQYYTGYDPDEPERESEFKASVEEYSADMDVVDFKYLNDGFELLWPPYLLGPYASGTIHVFIPYEAAGIDINK